MKNYNLIILLTLISVSLFYSKSYANPGFARKYNASCALCHKAFPKLNSYGETFMANGYQMSDESPNDYIIDTGDEMLNLMKKVPVSFRIDSYMVWRDDSETNYDMQIPYGLKLISSAILKKDISYYFYFFLSERGDLTGIEDAFLYFNSVFGVTDLDIQVGQFAVTDAIVPRETRLTRADYEIYKTKASTSGTNLTYDRGININYSNSFLNTTLGVVNGNGIGKANDNKSFDSDNNKNLFGRISTDFFNTSIGFFGYSGKEKSIDNSSVNNFNRIGPDININLPYDINLFSSWLWGKDTNPEFTTSNKNEIRINGGFIGAEMFLSERWLISLLYNRVYSKEKTSLNLETASGNISYYLMRNMKFTFEYSYDLLDKNTVHTDKTSSLSFGIVAAF